MPLLGSSSTPTTAAGVDDRMAEGSRSRFEAWVSAPPIEKSVEIFGPEGSWPGQYRDYEVQLMWESWQLATEENIATLDRAADTISNSLVRHGFLIAMRTIKEQK